MWLGRVVHSWVGGGIGWSRLFDCYGRLVFCKTENWEIVLGSWQKQMPIGWWWAWQAHQTSVGQWHEDSFWEGNKHIFLGITLLVVYVGGFKWGMVVAAVDQCIWVLWGKWQSCQHGDGRLIGSSFVWVAVCLGIDAVHIIGRELHLVIGCRCNHGVGLLSDGVG